MNVTNASLAELFSFFANMKGDIDQYRDHETVRKAWQIVLELDPCFFGIRPFVSDVPSLVAHLTGH